MSEALSDLGPQRVESWRHELGLAEAEFHWELGSTNDRARELISRGIATPAIVVTERQTTGRGRGDHQWLAARGALTFSLVLNPQHACGAAWISLATAIGVAEAIQTLPEVTPSLKWPNDVQCAGRKVAGILLETTASPARLIVGVGLNVNNPIPPDLQASAVALNQLHAGPVSLSRMLMDIVRKITQRLATDAAELQRLWQPQCALRGRQVTVTQGDRTLTAHCHGVQPSGQLGLLHEGQWIELSSGSVRVCD